MMSLIDLLRMVEEGNTSFSPANEGEQAIKEFQSVARALIHAEQEGFLERCVSMKDSMRGQHFYRNVVVIGGLTYKGEGELRARNFLPAPSEPEIRRDLAAMRRQTINDLWSKALLRKHDDPAGAITAARSLVEATCKSVLDELEIKVSNAQSIGALYKQTAQALEIEDMLLPKACASLIHSLGELRNSLSDAHGKVSPDVPTLKFQAELAVTIAGGLSQFVAATFSFRQTTQQKSR